MKVTFKETPIELGGSLPTVGGKAPAFTLTGADLTEETLEDFAGENKILNIVPSLDTPVCALSAQKFNQAVSTLKHTTLINISADLPFAQKRFCESHSLKNIVTLSTFRSPDFGKDYGVQILNGPLAGLTARAVMVLDARDRVAYTELVPEITHEPDYEVALAAVRALAAP